MSEPSPTATLKLNFSGDCRGCGASVLLSAVAIANGRMPSVRGGGYAVECPCCGGIVWFVGELVPPADPRKLSIWDGGFGLRSHNVLVKALLGYGSTREDVDKLTLGDVTRFSEKEILCVRNAGKKVLEDIKQRLAEQGLSLRSE